MRVLDTSTLKLYDLDISEYPPPDYAILSHTWGEEEVTYDDMCGDHEALKDRKGFQKIVNFCQKAAAAGYSYGWVDTCCIDKRSSAELSEAINSMYAYYKRSEVCYIYLSDVRMSDDKPVYELIKDSRWFTRGWTLQELIAPSFLEVFDADWKLITPKEGVKEALSHAAGVPTFLMNPLSTPTGFCVAERMSWAAKRRTTREEDMAYCLMGLFDVHMTPIYGEGGPKAFRRLQMEIMQTSFDQTLFAWREPDSSSFGSGMLAESPSDFEGSGGLSIWGPRYLSPFSMTNVGLHIRLVDATPKNPELDPETLKLGLRKGTVTAMIQCDIKDETTGKWQGLAVYLKPVDNATVRINGSLLKAYRRIRSEIWHPVPLHISEGAPFVELLVLEDEHYKLVSRGLEADRSRFNREFVSSNPDICERDGFESRQVQDTERDDTAMYTVSPSSSP
ncbi:heterokaryon incompatibility protein-domain-containing protein [Podospora conica]|nr:heterokaryon incompatibility protein-domain-containing protein [Schizothecium conicum]